MHIIIKYKHKYLCVRWIIVILLSVHFQKTFPEDQSKPDIHIERIFPDESFWSERIEQSSHFFKICILPEILGRWYSRPHIQQENKRNTTKVYIYHRHRNIYHSHFIVIAGSPKAMNRHGLPVIILAAI